MEREFAGRCSDLLGKFRGIGVAPPCEFDLNLFAVWTHVRYIEYELLVGFHQTVVYYMCVYHSYLALYTMYTVPLGEV